MLFCTDAVQGAIPTTTLMQIYDLKIRDIDGNGEADILFLAQRLTTVTFGDNPGIYFMVELQENGEFRFLSSRIGTDLGNIVSKLHDRQRANRRLDNILCELKEYAECGGLKDVKLLELDYEDQDGDGTKDIRMLVECQMKPDGEIKKKYEVIFYQEASPENPMKRFVRTSEKEIITK